MIRRYDDDGQLSIREILLIADILVAGDQNIEALMLRRIKQCTVLESLPSQFIRACHLMFSQILRQWGRCVGIE